MPLPPTQRRWHRWAVLELSILAATDRIVSFHMFRRAAANAAARLVRTASVEGRLDPVIGPIWIEEVRDFIPVPVGHYRVTIASEG